MRGWLAAASAIAVFGFGAAAQAQAQTAFCAEHADVGADVEAVRALELRGAAINVEGWSEAEARAFFAPEWFSVQLDGSRVDLATVLARFQDGRMPGWARRFDLPRLDIRIYCDMAIAVGDAEIEPRNMPADAEPMRFRYMNIWRRAEGGWLYTAQLFYPPSTPAS